LILLLNSHTFTTTPLALYTQPARVAGQDCQLSTLNHHPQTLPAANRSAAATCTTAVFKWFLRSAQAAGRCCAGTGCVCWAGFGGLHATRHFSNKVKPRFGSTTHDTNLKQVLQPGYSVTTGRPSRSQGGLNTRCGCQRDILQRHP
jgi:hypothetical protein